MTTRPHRHCCVFARGISCCCPTLTLPSRTSGNSSWRRWWHTPWLFSSGQRRPICLPEVNHTFWQGAYWSSGGDELLCLLLWWGCIQWCGSPGGTPVIPPEEATPKGTQPTLADPPVKEATVDIAMESTAEKKPLNQFPGWEKVLHPSRPIVAARQIPPLLRGLKPRSCNWSLGERLVWHHQTDESRMSATQSESPSPTKESEVVW